MLQQNTPDDYVISTGQLHSVKKFLKIAFHYIDIPIIWKGKGLNEIGIDKKQIKLY